MNLEGIPNRSSVVKKWEGILFLPALPILIFSIAMSWQFLALGLLGYAILTQGFIFMLYRKEGRGKEFLTRMIVPLLGALILLGYFGWKFVFPS